MATNHTIEATTLALQNNPQTRQQIVEMLSSTGDGRSPEQWLVDDLNEGDTNSHFNQIVRDASVQKLEARPSVNVPGGPTQTGGSSPATLDLGTLVGASAAPAVPQPPPITPVSAGFGPQGYSQNEVGAQTGGYTSVGANAQTQTGQQTQQGTERGVQTTQQQGTTAQTTQALDPFNLTSLVGAQLGSTSESDANNRAWLSDFRDTGGTAFGSQIDQAIRRSVSGPQMIGTGESAQARAAGYGAAEVARGNAGQRLQAAQQLGSPTSLAQTVGAVSPLLGQSTTGTTNQAGNSTSDATRNSNTIDLQQLVGQEAQAGTATGQSVSQGSGVAPAGQQVKSGGCVVCTAYVSQGLMKPGAVRRACRYKQANWSRYGTSLTGYLFYGPFIARAVLYNETIRNLVRPLARAILYEEVRLSAPTRLRKKWNASISHAMFDFLSWPVGATMKLAGLDADVRDEKVKAMLVKQNLNFSL